MRWGKWAGCGLMLLAMAGCEPDLNDNECRTDDECASLRPGTVCSPENWCVRPEAITPDPDMMTAPDMFPEPDMAPDGGQAVDMAPVEGDMAPVEGDMAPVEGDMAPVEGDMALMEADTAADMGPEGDMGPMEPEPDMDPVEPEADMAPMAPEPDMAPMPG